ncbi:ATP-dependent RNA helicase HrpB [compost metagenome]
MSLPIDEIIPDLKEALNKSNCAVLLAEPGAGKTTRTPLALLGEPWLEGQGIIMLEPRRLAARSAAAFMAAQLGEEVGGTVGYKIRMDSRTSSRTRIAVVTEGILTRMLQADPALEGTGLVIFDEYHERSLQADLGLALSLQSQGILREDLRIVVMSATLAAEPVSRLMNDAPVLQSQGRTYPVETIYLTEPSSQPPGQLMAGAIRSALSRHEGGILAFLPGIREIRRVQMSLLQGLPPNVDVVPLYGSMPQHEQLDAIRAPRTGHRKIVLATSIAESSLTVEGIRVVIDCGLRRTQQFSARTGMGRLVTIRAARDSADQRRGRAGRTAPGVCYRLWTEQEDRQLPERTSPEILEADLSGLALELAVWGVKDPAELQWLDLPRTASFCQAQQLLTQLQAMDSAGNITAHGQQMAGLGLHPRLSHMILEASRMEQGKLACFLAALLEERDIFPRHSSGGMNNDLRARLEVMTRAALEGAGRTDLGGAHRADVERLLSQGRQWISRLPDTSCAQQEPTIEAADLLCGLLLSFAFPDRIGQRRMDGRYLLRSGRGAEMVNGEQLVQERYIVAAEVDDEGTEARILLAAPLTESQLEHHFRKEMNEELEIKWDERSGTVRAKSMIKLGAIVIKETANVKPTAEQIQMALLERIQDGGIHLLPWDVKSRQLQARIRFMREYCGKEWPDVSDATLQQSAGQWLSPYLEGFKRSSDFRLLKLHQILDNLLNWSQKQELEQQAPTHITVPSGSRIAVNYEGPQAPYISVRLQELFGLMDTPRLAYGHAAVTLHILSPASRPVQVTSDLRSFWENTYFDVKKDLKGRYPKHYWPDNPLEATATKRVRPTGDRK